MRALDPPPQRRVRASAHFTQPPVSPAVRTRAPCDLRRMAERSLRYRGLSGRLYVDRIHGTRMVLRRDRGHPARAVGRRSRCSCSHGCCGIRRAPTLRRRFPRHLFRADGFSLWDNNWYGGSLSAELQPAVAGAWSVRGAAPIGALSGRLVWAFSRLLRRWSSLGRMRRGRLRAERRRRSVHRADRFRARCRDWAAGVLEHARRGSRV